MKDYVIHHNNKTIELTRAFAEKSSQLETKEITTLIAIREVFPDYNITVKEKNSKKGSKLNYNKMEKKLIAH